MADRYSHRNSRSRDIHDQYRDAKRIAAKAQDDTQRSATLAALQQTRNELIARGVMESALPRLGPNMSARDMAEAAARLSVIGGASPTAARKPAQLGATMEQARVQNGLPPRPAPIDPLNPRDPMAPPPGGPSRKELRDAAGTGKVIETPYGTIQSTTVDWQKELAAKHPELGKAGTSGNAEFVAAFKAAKADPSNSGKTDAELGAVIADNIFSRKPAGVAENPGDPLYRSPVAGSTVNPKGIFAPLRPVTFGGMDAGPSTAGPMVAPSAGHQAAQTVRGAVASALEPMPFQRKARAFIDRGIEKVANAGADVLDFMKGIVGQPGNTARYQPARQHEPATSAGVTETPAVSLPPFDWKSPMPADMRQGPKLALETPLGSTSTDDDLVTKFLQSDQDEDFKKKMVFTGFR